MAQPIIIGKKYLFSTFTDTKKHIVMHAKKEDANSFAQNTV